MSQSIISIQNPNETEEVIAPGYLVDGSELIDSYGEKIKYGAFVVIIDLDDQDEPDGDSETFIADRIDDTVYLHTNSALTSRESGLIDRLGSSYWSGDAPEANTEPQEEFTVFGTNDDGEKFVALVTATPATVVEEGRKAGATVEGYEDQVTVVLAVKGDQRTLGEELPAAV